ncbi:MAG: hypothetical protein QHH18_06820 [Candidatus Bathyarchaeota archaeon]|jgi:hypothetical protein|nr:hypothetical protein [Candidatus Bathyarchaeota archaeon A05DMB-5]MDH7558294.1 hypothetical protein [Candidatus Bathyarchaeota archaeon]
MKRKDRRFRSNSSAQLLIVAALAIAILISATTTYVYELGKETNGTYNYPISDSILAIKQTTRNALISSLANISNGGEKTLLVTNLNELSQSLRNLTQFGIWQLSFIVLDDSTYDSGVWLSWDTNDVGVSSAYTDFTLRAYDVATNSTVNYAVNVTTTITVSGYYMALGIEKMVNLTCNMYNEGEPALAQNITLFYENLGIWMPIDSSNNLSITDYGNGTYAISFRVVTLSDTVQVSTHLKDLRGIFVQTNTTCTER